MHANGVVRVVWQYSDQGIAASMTQHVLIGAVPSPANCSDLANAAAEWELDGASPGLSYRLHRSSLSYLEAVTATSLDSRRNSVGWVLIPPDVGQGANSVSDALSPNVAALVHWRCLPSQRRRQAWTYAPCLTHDHVDRPGATHLSQLAADALAECFQGQITLLAIDRGGVLVALSRPTPRNGLSMADVSVIADVDMGDRALCTQRRRLRRGR